MTKIILHQTWKNDTIPYNLFSKEWIDSWKKFNFDYMFWTDDDNRRLIRDFYPELLEIYDSYDKSVKRCDLARYCMLDKFGGLYADLDCIGVNDYTKTLEENSLVLTVEPVENTMFSLGKMMLSNALMYSKPGHKFWSYVFKEALKREYRNTVAVIETGPAFLTRAHDAFVRDGNTALILGAETFLWSKIPGNKNLKDMEFKDGFKMSDKVFAIHIDNLSWNASSSNYLIYKYL